MFFNLGFDCFELRNSVLKYYASLEHRAFARGQARGDQEWGAMSFRLESMRPVETVSWILARIEWAVATE